MKNLPWKVLEKHPQVLNLNFGKFSIYRGNYSGKKIKTKQKKIMTCHFYQRNYRRNLSIGKIRQ
jgi:hypothetical protein